MSTPTTLAPDLGAGRRHLPLLALAIVVVVWGAGPVVTKLITAHPLIGTVLRFAISIPVLFALVQVRGGRVTGRLMRSAALPGLAFGINLIFVFAAVQEVAVAVLSFAVALQPALLLIVGGRLLGEQPSRAQVLLTLVGVAATGGVVMGAGDELRASPIGIVLALAALSTFTIYFALTRVARSTENVDPFEWMAAINVWSLVAAFVPALFVIRRHHLDELDRVDLLWLMVLALVTGIAGHVLMSWVHGYIEASRSSLYLLGMNITAAALAWPVHDEPVTVLQMICGLVVLGAVAGVISLPSRTVTEDA